MSTACTTGRRAQRLPARGAVALLTLLLLPVLAGFAALVIDVGRIYVFKTEVQNAMDACALAASAPLTGANNPAIFDQARAYGLALSDPTKVGAAARDTASVNRLHFQRDNFNNANVSVEFSSALSGQPWVAATSLNYAGITPQTAKFVRCSYLDTNNALFLVPLLRPLAPGAISTMSVGATAAASLAPSQSACAFPVAVCAASGSTAASNYGHAIGERLTAVNNPGSGYGTGNFGWLDFTPPSGGASELRDLIAGSGSCSIAVGTPVGQPGVVSTAETVWNTRFGIYKSPTYTTSNGPPDFTGYSYPSSSNNFADYEGRLAARAQFQGNLPSSGNPSKITSAQHASVGAQRRIAVAAVVDCFVWHTSPSSNPVVKDFSCILLLAPVRDGGPAAQYSETDANETMDIEYLGLANAAGSPCASSGLSGGTYGPLVPNLVQ